jgi:hypothetical protein
MFDLLPLFPHADDYFDVFPVEELDEGITCDSCDMGIAGWAYFDGDGFYCTSCAEALTREWFGDAQAFAKERCKIIHKLPAYDPACEYRCTPEEYEEGSRESYTPNAYLCRCRHECTNYDELIADLSRDHAEDRVYYEVIRHRIDELLIEHEDFMHEEDEDEEEEESESPTP